MGWSNQIPNPFIVGGSGVSGEIDVYDANGVLIVTIGASGITVIDAVSSQRIAISPNGNVSNLPSIEYTSTHTPANDAAAIVAADNPVISGTALIVSSTSYINTVTGVANRSVVQVAANNSYMASRRNSDLLYGGGYVSAKDAAGAVGYATAGTAITEIECGASKIRATGMIYANNAGAAEDWHTLTLASGWTGTLKYRGVASPPNTIQIVGNLTPGTKADGTTIGTLPAGYRPATGWDLPGQVNITSAVGTQSPHFNITTAGAINCWGFTAATAASINGLLPLDA